MGGISHRKCRPKSPTMSALPEFPTGPAVPDGNPAAPKVGTSGSVAADVSMTVLTDPDLLTSSELSALRDSSFQVDPFPPVRLRDAGATADPDAVPQIRLLTAGRYEIEGEIARG